MNSSRWIEIGISSNDLDDISDADSGDPVSDASDESLSDSDSDDDSDQAGSDISSWGLLVHRSSTASPL